MVVRPCVVEVCKGVDKCLINVLIVLCPTLADPNNGMIVCSLEDDGVHSYEHICTYTCNTGYEHTTGSPQRTCQSDGSWSGSPVSCTIMECTTSSLPMNSMLAESCSSTYQSMCDVQCEEGFNSSGSYRYVCNVSSNGLKLLWRSAGENITCVAGMHLFDFNFTSSAISVI